MELLGDCVGSRKTEVVFRIVSHLAPATQQRSYFILSLSELSFFGLRHYEVVFFRGKHLLHRFIRNIDRAILIAAIVFSDKEVVQFLNDTDYGKRLVVYEDLLVERLNVREKLVGNVRSDHAHVRAMLVFNFGEVPAFGDVHRRHAFIVSGRALDLCHVKLLVLISDFEYIVRAEKGRHVLYRRALFPDRQRILIAYWFAHSLLRREPAGMNARVELIDENSVGPERLDVVLELLVKSGNEGCNYHDRNSADDDSENGQERAELVRLQCCKRHSEAFSR